MRLPLNHSEKILPGQIIKKALGSKKPERFL